MNRTTPQGATDAITRKLLVAGAVSGPLFIATFLLEGMFRQDYNPLRHPVSSLAIGELGWMQIVNFVVLAILLFSFALGLRRIFTGPKGSKLGPLLIMFVAVGFLGAGLFVADPLTGYPLGTPGVPVDRTLHGILHDVFSTFFFLGFPVAGLVFAHMFHKQKNAPWKWYSAVSAVAMYAAFVLANQGFKQNPDIVAYGGMWQRIAIIIALTYFSILAVRLLGRASRKTL